VVTRAYIVGVADAAGRGAIGGLTVETRQRLSLRDAGIDESIEVSAGSARVRSDAAALVAPAGTIWHPAIVKRLAHATIAADEVVAVGSADAAVYLCGPDRVAATVSAVAAHGHADVRFVPADARAREFVVRPRSDFDRRTATTLLLRSLEKPSDGLASRYLHRPVSRWVTRQLLACPITPNQMTLVAAVFGVAGVAVAWRGGYGRLLAGAALFEIQNVLDGCDGEIARLKHLRSRGGEWLDQVIDDVLNIAFLASVGSALARGGSSYAWPVTRIAVAAQIVHMVGLYAGLLFRAGGRGSVARLVWFVGGGEGRSLVGDLTRRDIIAAAYLVTAVLDVIAATFLWHAVVTFGSAAVTTLQWIVWRGPDVQADGDGAAEKAGGAPV
jgi:phosphatidylglycerophosphate synthase